MERLDIAIIGSGPAGISAAINAKVRNKTFVVFGNKDMSSKLVKAHEINNYLGFYGKSGHELKDIFMKHASDMGICITEARVTNIYHVLLVVQVMEEDLPEGQHLGLPIHQGQVDDAEGGLKIRVLIELI